MDEEMCSRRRVMRGSDFLKVSDDTRLNLAGFRTLLGRGCQSDNGVGCHGHEQYKLGQ